MKMNDELDELLNSMRPAFKPLQKVWLKVGGDMAGMVLGIVAYPDRYAYIVRWGDGDSGEYGGYELADAKTW
jgi:hypothetical protein